MLNQLDDILTHLGTGSWTVLHFLTMGFSSFFIAPHGLGGALLAPRLDFTCQDAVSHSTAFSSLATDTTNDTLANYTTLQYDEKCQYWIDTPEGRRIEQCVDFGFDNSTFSSTVTSEYNLVCDRSYLQTSFQSVYMLGVFIGSPINGFLADKYGRKRVVIVGMLLYLIIGLGSAWLPYFATILLARFALGMCHAICIFTTYVLMIEVMEPKFRPAAGFSIYLVWALGTIAYGAFGYWIRDWRLLQTALTLPGLLILPGLWLMDESPRWLLVNGRPKEALQVLKRAASWHKIDIPPEAEMKALMEEDDVKKCESQPFSLRQLLVGLGDEIVILVRTPRLRIISICVFLDYLMASMVYFGLSLSGATISDDPYVYMMLSGLMEVPAYTLTIPIVQRFGRKLTLAACFLLSAIALFGLAGIPADYKVTGVVLAMIGKVCITAGFQTTIFFSSELFPTEVRSRGVSASYMMSRIGSMVSPFITDLVGSVYPWAPFVVFGVGALLSGAVTFLLPETKGQTLPDTVEQLEQKRSQQEE